MVNNFSDGVCRDRQAGYIEVLGAGRLTLTLGDIQHKNSPYTTTRMYTGIYWETRERRLRSLIFLGTIEDI